MTYTRPHRYRCDRCGDTHYLNARLTRAEAWACLQQDGWQKVGDTHICGACGRDLTHDAIDAGTYGEPAPEKTPETDRG